VTEHDLNVSCDDCAYCAEGCAPDRIDPKRAGEHFRLAEMAAAPPATPATAASDETVQDSIPTLNNDLISVRARIAARAAVQRIRAANTGPGKTIDINAIYAARARAMQPDTPKQGDQIDHHDERVGRDGVKQPAKIDADAIYAARAAAMQADTPRQGVAQPHQKPATKATLDPNAVYAARRADLTRNQSPPARTDS
jgi:hypothetical protein